VLAFAPQRRAPPPEGAGGPPRGRLDLGVRAPAAAPPRGHRVGIELVMLGLAAMDGVPGEGVSRDNGDGLCSAETGEPIPGAQACDGDDETLTVGRNGLEERCRRGVHRAGHQDLTSVAQEADGHGTGMPVDTTVQVVLVGGETPEVSSACVSERFPQRQQSHGGLPRERPQSVSTCWSGRGTPRRSARFDRPQEQ
jgi:hypothetical protein